MTRPLEFALSAVAVLVLLTPNARGGEAVVTVTVAVVAACAEGEPADCRPISAPAFAAQPYVLSPELEGLRRERVGGDAPQAAMPLVTVIY